MRAPRRSSGFTLIELLIVIIIIGILAAIAIPMFLSQRDKAKDAAVEGGVHDIELGIASWAIDHQDFYPDVVDSTAATTLSGGGPGPAVGTYLDAWPRNAWSGGGADMVDPDTKGDYRYTPLLGRSTFTLAGHMSSADFVVP